MPSQYATAYNGRGTMEVYKKEDAMDAYHLHMVFECLGSQNHQPSKKIIKNMSRDEWAMRSFHAAAADGCLPCLMEWVTAGLDVTWESPNAGYTAMSWIDYQLTQASRDPVMVQRLTICKSYLANLNPQ
jgi:hypothetical protein